MSKNSINNINIIKDKIIKTNDIQELKELNIQLMEENTTVKKQNLDFIEKIKALNIQDKQIQESFLKDKEGIKKLENELLKKNDEIQGLITFISKLQSQLEKKDDNLALLKKKTDEIEHKDNKDIKDNKSGDESREFKSKNIKNKINEYEKKISMLENKNRELQFKLEEKEVQKELHGFRTEDNYFSNYEEEFDLRKMVSGARDKNRSEDINIDYPGVQNIKDKYKELLRDMNYLQEQIKIVLLNININNKIRAPVKQICQLMRISAKNIELIINGKDKKKALGIIN